MQVQNNLRFEQKIRDIEILRSWYISIVTINMQLHNDENCFSFYRNFRAFGSKHDKMNIKIVDCSSAREAYLMDMSKVDLRITTAKHTKY